MPRVTSTQDADTVVLRWGEDGVERVVREGDEAAGRDAFVKCVAEGLTRGDVIEGDEEMAVAKALLADAVFLTVLPTTGDISLSKAGRVLSAPNLAALQQIHDSVGALIQSELGRRQAAADDTSDAENTPEKGGGDSDAEKALTYVVTKADGDQMYTFGPLYAPNRKDAHGEFTDTDTLQKAVHEYVQQCVDNGDNQLNVQHDADGLMKAGRWVEVCAWPYESVVKLKVPGESERSVTLPAGTIYMGIQWNDSVWKAVKEGKIAGLSLGGRAMRVASGEDVPPMGDKKAGMGEVCDSYSGDGMEPCTKCGYPMDDH